MRHHNPINHAFKRVFGALYFYKGDILTYQSRENDEYSFLFDKTTGIIQKHGTQPRVSHWLERTPDRLNQASVISATEHLIMVSKPAEGDDAWDVELLNRFIHQPGAIVDWYNEQEETQRPEF